MRSLVVVAHTFGQLPSALLQRAAPELAWLSPLDWHVFDTTAALVYQDMQNEGADRAANRWAEHIPGADRRPGRGRRTPRQPGWAQPSHTRGQRGVAREGGGEALVILGTETPPWEQG